MHAVNTPEMIYLTVLLHLLQSRFSFHPSDQTVCMLVLLLLLLLL